MSLQLSQPGLFTGNYQRQSPPLPQRLGDRETILPDGETSERWFLGPWIQRDTYHLEETEDAFIIYHKIYNALRKGGRTPIFRVLTSTKGNLLGALGFSRQEVKGSWVFPGTRFQAARRLTRVWSRRQSLSKSNTIYFGHSALLTGSKRGGW